MFVPIIVLLLILFVFPTNKGFVPIVLFLEIIVSIGSNDWKTLKGKLGKRREPLCRYKKKNKKFFRGIFWNLEISWNLKFNWKELSFVSLLMTSSKDMNYSLGNRKIQLFMKFRSFLLIMSKILERMGQCLKFKKSKLSLSNGRRFAFKIFTNWIQQRN